MLLLLLGFLKALEKDHHKDIKILTEDREYELRLTPEAVFKERLMFLPTTSLNNRENIFTYDSEYGGIKTMYNDFLTKDIQLNTSSRHIIPSRVQNNVDDWHIKGLSHFNTIKNSLNLCFKRGKYQEELDAYDLLTAVCSVSDKDQRFIVVEIPRKPTDVCKLLNVNNSTCADDYIETVTDVKSRPMLI
ncbi:hypothetical protein NGRA_0604 [Nosema granulosis]|uniref:Uncharacterized protein n=1 Tax=Nosema granulosis TaxID=83296 RepID=A0A9P6H2R1_9MICR|nr:hypothetical protein NGRA_0604 [Nosema granulosis]